MANRDLVLLETVTTHRARLASAFVFGELAERRVTNDNLRRLLGGIVLAAVVCAGCVGFSFVSSILGNQAATQRQQAALGPATGPIVVADTFDRRTTAGWGRTERGGVWRVLGPRADYAVAQGAGTVRLPEGDLRGAYLPSTLQDRTDVTATLQREAGARTGTVTVGVLGRRVSSTQDYRAVVRLGADGSVALSLVRRAQPTQFNDGTQGLSPTVILLGPSEDQPDAAPDPIAVRVQVIGTAPTTVRAKAWVATGTEPSDWTVQGSDSAADLQRPGAIGLTATRSGGPASARNTLAVTDIVARTAP